MSPDDRPTADERLAALERQMDGLEVIMARSERLTQRMIADQARSKINARAFREQTESFVRSLEERIGLLDSAFNAAYGAVIDHATDPEAHRAD